MAKRTSVWPTLLDVVVLAVAGIVTLTVAQSPAPAAPPRPRPFYVIAHRTNSIDAAARALASGANGLEIDVRYDDGRFCANHDAITEALGCEDLARLLGGVRDLAARHALALVMLDLKAVEGRGDEVLALAREQLTGPTGIKLLVSVAKLDRSGDLPRGRLRRERRCPSTRRTIPRRWPPIFEARGTARWAYGNGTAPTLVEVDVRDGIERALRRGDIGFVYVWTLEKADSMREYLTLGVDGILVNGENSGGGVIDAVEVLVEEVRAGGLWLATRDHDPFAG
jgi:glycerophosphoryl diester phosphodiesterase